MGTNMEDSRDLKRTCDICKMETGVDLTSVLDYGPWQEKCNLLVHYYCLLLSSNLLQNGTDQAGILGFEIRDIRKLIAEAAKVKCCYCDNPNATVKCCQCNVYFHMVCGTKTGCLFQFDHTFNSYCANCYPLNAFQMKVQKEKKAFQCYICNGLIPIYNPVRWIYGPCCNNGFVHTMCMRRYAYSAGYYLKCIWCKSTDFRAMVKQLGVFVPDREASWETKRAYQDLHQGHNQCDVEKCLCPRGRDYTSSKWEIILCECCGGFGAHNPICLNGVCAKEKVERYKCNTCIAIETQLQIAPYTDEKENPMENASMVSNNSVATICPMNTSTANKQPAANREIILCECCGGFGAHNPICLNSVCANEKNICIAIETQLQIAPNTDEMENPMENAPMVSNSSVATICPMNTTTANKQPADPIANMNNYKCNILGNDRSSCFSRSSSVETVASNTPVKVPINTLETADDDNFITIDCIAFDEHDEPSGTAVARINLNSPRFKGMTVQEISDKSDELIRPDDITYFSDDLSVIHEINRVIQSFVEAENRVTQSFVEAENEEPASNAS